LPLNTEPKKELNIHRLHEAQIQRNVVVGVARARPLKSLVADW
jgi:hypothetical protein